MEWILSSPSEEFAFHRIAIPVIRVLEGEDYGSAVVFSRLLI
jgi:hypothetical protein